ncbi:MAG TPA: hypothetical protein VFN23_03780 [Ktedonobacteraceae bacterium]|nr:hypothetical protein [Ktedonobacteraceae bacterium]
MALFDDLDKQTWREHSRLARERSDLSASVEEALADETLPGNEWWDVEDLDNPGKLPENMPAEASGSAVIPPRISLQSRPIEAVSPGSPFMEMANRQSAEIAGGGEGPATASGQAPSELRGAVEQSEHVLLRLAHRITTSLASFGSVLQPSALVPQIEEAPAARNTISKSSETSLSEPPTASSQVDGIVTMKMYPSPPKTPVVVESRPLPAIPARPSRPAGRLGRTTKVHLKVAPKSDKIVEMRRPQLFEKAANAQPQPVEPPVARDQSQPASTAGSESEPLVGMLDTSGYIPAVKSTETPTMATTPETLAQASADLPTRGITPELQAPPAGAETSSRTTGTEIPAIAPQTSGMLFGSGQFEGGQADAVVSNAATQTNSVVVVTLAGDPGPVVVQYCSLQAGVGFTVHLSASAKRRTPFNYALLGPQN